VVRKVDKLTPEAVLDLIRREDVEGVLAEMSRNPDLKRPKYFNGRSLLEAAMILNCFPLVQSLLVEQGIKPTKDILDLRHTSYYYLKLRVPHPVALFVYSCDLHSREISQFLFDRYIADLEPGLKAMVLGECLACVCGDNRPEQVHWLVEQGADVNYDKGGVTPLIIAASVGANEAILALLSHGCKINYREKRGSDALWTAVLNRKTETVRLLLQQGADPYNAKVRRDKTYPDELPAGNALDVARHYGNEELIEALTNPGIRKEVRFGSQFP
jgi:hypothetical protein